MKIIGLPFENPALLTFLTYFKNIPLGRDECSQTDTVSLLVVILLHYSRCYACVEAAAGLASYAVVSILFSLVEISIVFGKHYHGYCLPIIRGNSFVLYDSVFM